MNTLQQNSVTYDNLPNAVSLLIDEVKELKKLVLKSQLKKVKPVNGRITVDINRAAEITHLSKSSIYLKRRKGELPGGMKKGQKILWYEDDLLQWIDSGKVLTQAEIDAAADALVHK